MKKLAVLTIALSALISSAFTVLTVWKANQKASTVNFELPGSDKKGTFSNLVSSINFDKKKLAESKITASIDVRTLKMGNEKLETHLISADFFNAEKFPSISFTSSEIKKTDSGFLAKGSLTMKDSTKVIELPFTFKEDGKSKAVFSGTMSVNASEYGVMKPEKAGKDKVLIYLVVPVSK